MYDTVVLKSPEIDIETRDRIKSFCNQYESLNLETGELLYSYTSGKLEGSYDYRIRIGLSNLKWIKEDTDKPEQVETYWHLEVECSLHKILMNHNCYGGPVNAQESIAYLVMFIENTMNVKLPEYYWWEVKKIDVSRIYQFMDSKICSKVISNLKKSYYTRRKPQIYDTSVMFAGSTTTTKFYWKGPEFLKHDYKRLKKYAAKHKDKVAQKDYFDIEYFKMNSLFLKIEEIKNIAMRTIRFECSIKNRKLKDLFDAETVCVYMLHDETLHNCMLEELKKLIKEDDSMDLVRRSDLVLERLIKLYDRNLGNSLYTTWTKLVQFGESGAKETISERTFRRHKKQLCEAGVSWACSTINLKPFSIVPADFSFLNNNYANDEVDSEVMRKLAKVA